VIRLSAHPGMSRRLVLAQKLERDRLVKLSPDRLRRILKQRSDLETSAKKRQRETRPSSTRNQKLQFILYLLLFIFLITFTSSLFTIHNFTKMYQKIECNYTAHSRELQKV
jgi:hypothetical protein